MAAVWQIIDKSKVKVTRADNTWVKSLKIPDVQCAKVALIIKYIQMYVYNVKNEM